MKRAVRIFAILSIMLLSAVFLPTAAFAAYSDGGFSVDSVDYTADLRSDGSAVITEQWTVTFDDNGADGFRRDIVISDDNFERISKISDISASADGNNCVASSSGGKNGSYSYSNENNVYSVEWHVPSKGETHVFALRYIETGAVKLYNDRAYFYCTVVNEGSNLLCRNVTVTINAPDQCFPENFTIVESGSLAGEKADGKVTFKCDNSMGMIKTGISMPHELFSKGALIKIVDDRTGAKIASAALISALVIILVCAVFYAVNYGRILRKRCEKKCRGKLGDDIFGDIPPDIFDKLSPAVVMKTTLEKLADPADLFIVTALELAYRGYISDQPDGFEATVFIKNDKCKRKLEAYEKEVVKFFRNSELEKMLSEPEEFYRYIVSFNKKVKTFNPFDRLIPEKRKMILNCFKIKLAADGYEAVSPCAISDDFFGKKKYNVSDLLMSVIVEAEHGKIRTDESRYMKNLFILRKVFDEGKAIHNS